MNMSNQPAKKTKVRVRGSLVGSLLLLLLTSQGTMTGVAIAARGNTGARVPVTQRWRGWQQGRQVRLSQLPAALARAIRRTVGSQPGADYRLHATAGGYGASNAGQGLQVLFTSAGPELSALSGGIWRLGLRLTGIGHGGVLPLGRGRIQVSGGMIRYHRAGLIEWYRNGPTGIEQGFTVERVLGGERGPLVLRLSTSGTLHPAAASAGQRLVFCDREGREELTYGGLTVRDAHGRVLESSLAIDGRVVRLTVRDTGAAYPLQIDPYLQSHELTAPDGAAGDYFGLPVALSSDGTVALVGAPYKNSQTGAAYILSGHDYETGRKLTAGDGAAGDKFGYSVALSSDGSVALVGAYGKNTQTGAAYVFSVSAGNTTQTAELTASGGTTNDLFGWSVALSGNGSVALVGAPMNGGYPGAAYVFSGTGYATQQTLTASDGANGDFFGSAVALSSDGSVALVGAAGKNSNAGAAYVFTGAGYGVQTELAASDAASNDWFGYKVALNGSGSVALVGAYGHNSNTGAAYVFTGTLFGNQKELSAPGGPGTDDFGYSVALNGSGSVALVGAPLGNSGTGAAYVFSGSGYATQQTLTASGGAAGADFGAAAALNNDPGNADDGAVALVGAPGPSGSAGAAYVLSGAGYGTQTKLVPLGGSINEDFGASVALSSDGSVALVADPGKNGGLGAAYVFSGTDYATRATLTAGGGAVGDAFGRSVALSGDGTVAAVGAFAKNNGTGAVYVFSGTGYTNHTTLTASGGAANDAFGYSVALNQDGSVALVGAVGANSVTGASYVFSGLGYATQKILTASDGAVGDYFGNSVALSSDGTVALVGASEKNSLTGAAYIFNGTGYANQTKLTASDGASNDWFGNSVALSGNGSVALVGAYGHNSYTGAAYAFSGSGYASQKELTASGGVSNDYFGFSVALDGDGGVALVGARGANSGTGAAYVFNGTGYATQTKLTASDGWLYAAGFGWSVALSGDGTVALVGATGQNDWAGAAYVFNNSTGPTAAYMSAVGLQRHGGGVTFHWHLSQPANVLGFDVYAVARNGSYRRLNARIIAMHVAPDYRSSYRGRRAQAASFVVRVLLRDGSHLDMPVR